MSEPVVWTEDGSPYSARFGDRYRTRTGGLAQALCVFLAGCGLPARWRGAERFTVLETGFGLGLNFLATWAAWEQDPQRCQRLHFVSIEAYPVDGAEILRSALAIDATAQHPPALLARLQSHAQELCSAWGAVSAGVQTLAFANGCVHLTLAVGDVQAMLQALDCQADAVFLDGFSPTLNPQMWSHATLEQVRSRCHSGTTLASYTVAAPVRASLKQLGFHVRKCPGLAPKRHRMEAVCGEQKSYLPPKQAN